MRQLKKPARSRQQPLPFEEANQIDRWSRLTMEQQQSCRQLISQLLEQVLRQERTEPEPHEGSASHER
jgi:hypothetical protein